LPAIKVSLGHNLAKQKKNEEAESFLLPGCEELLEVRDRIPVSQQTRMLNNTIKLLLEFYEETGQTAKAEAWRKKLAEATNAAPAQKP
jgi:hypothetical protein